MLERRRQEVELVAAAHEAVEASPDLAWMMIGRWPLPPGWSKAATALLVLLPPAYPTTPPYAFYTDSDLTLAGGGQPSNSSLGHAHADRAWRQFSFAVEEWRPHADPAAGHNLLTFLVGVAGRLKELT